MELSNVNDLTQSGPRCVFRAIQVQSAPVTHTSYWASGIRLFPLLEPSRVRILGASFIFHNVTGTQSYVTNLK